MLQGFIGFVGGSGFDVVDHLTKSSSDSVELEDLLAESNDFVMFNDI